MSDYERELDRFLVAWERVQQEMLLEDRIEELAKLRGLPVERVKSYLDQITNGLRQLHSPIARTQAELVDSALKSEPAW